MPRWSAFASIAVGVLLVGTAGLGWLWHDFYFMPINVAFVVLGSLAAILGIMCIAAGLVILGLRPPQ